MTAPPRSVSNRARGYSIKPEPFAGPPPFRCQISRGDATDSRGIWQSRRRPDRICAAPERRADCGPELKRQLLQGEVAMSHPALTPESVAVITGGAAGIGFAAAMKFAQLGMRVCIADVDEASLSQARKALSAASVAGAKGVMTIAMDVSRIEDIRRLEAAVLQRFGGIDVLMNNAGIQPGSNAFGPPENWQRVMGVNLWGAIHGSQVFVR